jgi:aryl-alcohol dehydrogenase-like predicted oxidoreductase
LFTGKPSARGRHGSYEVGLNSLAWLLHRQPAIIPVPGASSVAQLDEILAATELKLNAATLDHGLGKWKFLMICPCCPT